jgi:hypothetical protein
MDEKQQEEVYLNDLLQHTRVNLLSRKISKK